MDEDTEMNVPEDEESATEDGSDESGDESQVSLPEELKIRHNWKIMAYGQFLLGVKAVRSYEAFKKIGIKVSLRTAQAWFKEFRDGKIRFRDGERSGPPPKAGREERARAVKQAIETNPYITLRKMAELFNIGRTDVFRITRTELKLEKHKNLWVPIGLTKLEKDARVKRFEKLYPPKPKEKQKRRTIQPSIQSSMSNSDNFVLN